MARKPNILMIVCDQLRYDSLGFTEKNPVKTPNLDALARDSVWFDNAYTALPTCCPARQCMMAGKRAEIFGALWNYDITSSVASLTPERPTWPQSVKNADYRTTYIGKWHVSPTFTPLNFGYDEYVSDEDYAHWRAKNHPEAAFSCDFFGAVDPIELSSSHTHWLAQKATEEIRRYAGGTEPWHVRLDFSEPHLPCTPCAEFAALYRPEEMREWPSFGDTFEHKPYIQKQNILTWGNESRTWQDWQAYVARYFAVISQVDDAVGKVLTALQESGEAENTVILFTADHGDMCGSHRMIDKHYVLYDDTVHIPLLIHAPFARPHRVNGFVNNCLDMAATMTELTGAESFPTDGISLLPALRGEEEGLRDYAVSTLNGQQFGLFTQRMFRTARWKYIWNLTDTDELYDMENDPWELQNRIADPDLTATVADLRRRLYKVLKKEDPDLLRGGWLEAQLLENHKYTR